MKFWKKSIDLFSFQLAARLEEERIRRLMKDGMQGISPFAFNQEDQFQEVKFYSMFLRWKDFLTNLAKEV